MYSDTKQINYELSLKIYLLLGLLNSKSGFRICPVLMSVAKPINLFSSHSHQVYTVRFLCKFII